MRRWAIGLFIVSLILRIVGLGWELLWYDEAFTALAIKLPFLDMLAALRSDVHPPLSYLIYWASSQILGRSEFALRLPSAVIGSLAVVEMYNFARKLAGEKAGRFSSALMAILPAALYYSQEARMYSMLSLFTLLGARAVLDRNWLRWGLCLPLLVYTHNLGAIYAAILGLGGLVPEIWKHRHFFTHPRAPELFGIVLGSRVPIALGAGIAYLPWVPTLVHQISGMKGGFWLPLRDLSGVLYWMSFGTIFVRLPEMFLIHGIALVMALTTISLLALRRELRSVLLLLGITFLPPLILETASLAWRPILLDRALVPSGVMLMGLWGTGLSRLPRWVWRPLAIIAIPMLIALIVTYYLDPTHTRAPDDPTIQIVDDHWQEQDAIYHMNAHTIVSYDYYLPGKDQYTYPEVGSLAQSMTDETKIALGIKALEATPSDLRERGYKRLWLMLDVSVVSTQDEIDAGKSILATHQVLRRWEIYDEPAGTFELVLIQL